MAKRHIIPLGHHKPVVSQMSGIVINDKPVENEQFYCYRFGQFHVMSEQYKKTVDRQKALVLLNEIMENI